MNYSISLMMAQAQCESCSMLLEKPYIRCAQCLAPCVELCLCCFSGGFEQNSHKSDHLYEVIVSLFLLHALHKLVMLLYGASDPVYI